MRKIHFWLSLPFGVMVFVICLTGSVLVFKHELMDFFYPGVPHNIREGFFHDVMRLHRWLMLPDRALGRVIVGVSTLSMVVLLVSGVARWFKCRCFSVRRGVNAMRFSFDLHRVFGFYAALILIVCALTGLMWSFEWYRMGVASVLSGSLTPTKGDIPWKMVYSIHTGAWGGLASKWITFFASLLGASLPITGYLFYFKKKFKS